MIQMNLFTKHVINFWFTEEEGGVNQEFGRNIYTVLWVI